MQDHSLLSLVGKQVKENDFYKFSCALFAPIDIREKLFALYAFEDEITQIYFKTSDPLIREVRYKWWMEALDEAFIGQYSKSPILKMLHESGARKNDLKDMIKLHSAIAQSNYLADFSTIDQLFNQYRNSFEIASYILAPELENKHAVLIYKICFITALISNLPKILHGDYLKPITSELIDKYSYKIDIIKDPGNHIKLKHIIKDVILYLENDLTLLTDGYDQRFSPIFLNLVWVKEYFKIANKKNYDPISPIKLSKVWYLLKLYFSK